MRRGRPCSSFSIEKKNALILKKKLRSHSFTGYIYHLKSCFNSINGKNLQNIFLRRLVLVRCRLNVYRSVLILRNLPCPKKLLVRHLIPATSRYDRPAFKNSTFLRIKLLLSLFSVHTL